MRPLAEQQVGESDNCDVGFLRSHSIWWYVDMILETAILNVRPGQGSAFEAALRRARPLIAATPGFTSLKIHNCVETKIGNVCLWRFPAIKEAQSKVRITA